MLLLHCLLYYGLFKSREKFKQPYSQFFKALARRERDESLVSRNESLVSLDESLVSQDESLVSRDKNLVSRENGNLLLSGTVHYLLLSAYRFLPTPPCLQVSI